MARRDAARGRIAAHRRLVPGPIARDRAAGPGRPPLNEQAPLFSVVVPTRGDPSKLALLLQALDRQTFPRDRTEVILAFDGLDPDPEIRAHAQRIGARIVALPDRRGPGAARNAGARDATGTWLAFTEEDCIPAADWLERAAARINGAPEIDVVEGETATPSGGPVRRRDGGTPNYLPTNLFVRRDAFARAGGYSEDYFDSARGIYFREDSDFGFSLEAAGARVAFEPGARVTHPAEHPRFLDPLRWARRYEMDALLQRRHPERFRTRIEVAHLGPLRLRRTVLRASFAYLISLAAGGAALLVGERGVAALLVAMGGLMLIPIWAKWGFNPWRLPVVPLVPFVLAESYFRGARRYGAPS